MITTIKTIEEDLEPYILKTEIEDAVKHAPNSKAQGIDSIPIELIKMLSGTGIKCLHRLFNVIWKTQKTPQEWNTVVIVPIWKKKAVRGTAQSIEAYHS